MTNLQYQLDAIEILLRQLKKCLCDKSSSNVVKKRWLHQLYTVETLLRRIKRNNSSPKIVMSKRSIVGSK